MCDEIYGQPVESLRLSKGWRSSVRNAVLNVIGIVRIGRDQVQDYAERKQWTLAEAERWLSPLLAYDPRNEATS